MKHWLEELATIIAEPPAFIAVEYDHLHFERIRAQRPDFLEKLRLTWPSLSQNDLHKLSQTLAYEGDTHSEVFPNTKIVWLDEGRQVDGKNIDDFAKDRLLTYKYWANRNRTPTLEELGERSWQVAQPSNDTQRCEIFARRIIETASEVSSDWAIIVVGASHVTTEPNSMRSRLEDAGFDCEVTVLKNETE